MINSLSWWNRPIPETAPARETGSARYQARDRRGGLIAVIVCMQVLVGGALVRAGPDDTDDESCDWADAFAPPWCQGTRYFDGIIAAGGGYSMYGDDWFGPTARLDLQFVHGCERFLLFEQVSAAYARRLDPGEDTWLLSAELGMFVRYMVFPSVGYAARFGDSQIPRSSVFVQFTTLPIEIHEFVEPDPDDHTMLGVRIYFRMMVGLSSRKHAVFNELGVSFAYSTFTY